MVRLVADADRLPPLKPRDRRADRKSSKDCKQIILASVRQGFTVEEGCRQAGRSRKTYEYYRRSDPDFRDLMDRALQAKAEGAAAARKEVPDFPEFSERYLGTRLSRHHLQWYDLLEGREPRDLHPAQRYVQGDPDTILINTPPEHGKALALHTEVLTPFGWSTIGDLRVGDQVFGPDGKPTNVVAKSEVFEKPCSKVAFNCGESFTASDDHLWTVVRNRAEVTVTTRDLQVGDRLPLHDELHIESAEYELDPYLLGCWLGDGHTASGRFTSADQEIVDAFAAYRPREYAEYSYETTGLYRQLAELGLIGRKVVPEGYMLGSPEQRLALLQGLMDTDGTISVAGQASFTSTKRDLARGVLYLASSLGLRPTIRESRAVCNGKDCGPKWTVWFSPCGLPVFRLARKLRRVRPVPQGRHTTARLRTVTAVTPTVQVPTQCIRVDNDSHLFLIGRSLVPTHNSTTVTVNYVVWRICQDPSIRVLIISKTQNLAAKFLFSIKQRLAESAVYADLQRDFGPPGGWSEGASTWTGTQIRVAGVDSGEKDYTVEAVGLGGQIYGTRTDLVIMDDCVDNTNHQQFAAQIDWIQNIVGSRVADMGGRMLLVGTRMATVDLYSEILKPQYYSDGKSPWTYLTQPAVLEFADDPEDWETLWPVTNRPPVSKAARNQAIAEGWPKDGMWPAWPGRALARKRARMSPRNWSMVYMQDQVADDAVFKMEDVQGCIDRARYPGRMTDGLSQHRRYGMDGLMVIAGLDPAAAGCTAMVVIGLDRSTGVRWLLDVVNERGMPPHRMRSEIKRLTERYGITEWRVEKNAYQGSIVQDADIKTYINARGCLMSPHHTDAKKWDTDFGVASMAMLFSGWKEGRNLIRLPSQTQSEPVRQLVEQLCAWFPETKGLTDIVMATWFTEIRCRELMMADLSGWHVNSSEFTSERDQAGQLVVDLDMVLQQQGAGAWDGSLSGW